MQFSVWPNPSQSPAETLDTARWADANGWYGVWYADHYMPNTGSSERKTGDTHEVWAILPAIAAVTERVRLGPLVTPTSIHHPAVLANRATTIDHLSNGRMVLGLGAGWQINEHEAYGIELEAPGPRVTRFEESIQIIRSLLANDRTTFEGSVYTITDAPCDPKPVQSPLPIAVGTGSPRMSRITARYADEWNTWGTVDEAARRRATFAAACERAGRDASTMHMSVQALVVIGDGSAEAPRGMEDRWIAGGAEQIVDAIGRFGELGFDEFILPMFHMPGGPTGRRDALEQFDTDVASHLR